MAPPPQPTTPPAPPRDPVRDLETLARTTRFPQLRRPVVRLLEWAHG